MVFGQETDSLKTEKLTGFIGLGTGNFTFFGDVGRNYAQNNALVSNLGYQIRLSTPLSKNIDFSFNTLFGKLTVNERSSERNLNFQTEIRGGGIALDYNFNNLLGPNRLIYPYISVGIGSFEFLSKTDLIDNNGNPYHYWSDGSIRDLAQTDPNALGANIVTQDYVYESDLRELNLDNFGDYRERTFSYPLGVGVQMEIHDKVNFRLGTNLYLNQTDLIDNVTNESIGVRAGDSKKDRFLFTSFSLNYNISISDKNRNEPLNEELLAQSNESDREDEDNDGVYDIIDNCPHTPPNVDVDEQGCPFDIDRDFVPNYRDKEIQTPTGMEVDTMGLGLNDEYFLEKHQNYQKLWGDPNIVTGIIQSGEDPLTFEELKSINDASLAKKRKAQLQNIDMSLHNRTGEFSVLLGSTKTGITEELSMVLLSVPDMTEKQIGDSTYYMTEQYEQLEDAVLRQMSLYLDNVVGKVVEVREDKIVQVKDEAKQIQNDVLKTPELINKTERGITYRVQLGAFQSDRDIAIYEYLDDVVKLKGHDGLTRYLSGSFTNPADAAKHKIDLLLDGYIGAFLSAYKDGERIELEDAGMEVLQKINYAKLWNEVNNNAFDISLLEYRILLGKFEGVVPPRTVNKFISLGDVSPVRNKSFVYYLKGHYKTLEEAQIGLSESINAGVIDAEITGEYKNKLITVEEVKKMRNE
ncbi:MAG: hypothetical protein ACI81Y_000554 [Glaciecola sp.]|jgi:hypothetical protein